MIEKLTGPQRRAVAVGLLVGSIALVYLLFLGPLIGSYKDYDERIEQLRSRLAKFQKNAEDREVLQRQFEQLKKQIGKQQAGYLKGKTQALAAAEMQDHVKRVIEAAAGHLTSIQTLQDQKQDESKSRVTIKVQMTGAITTVQKVFHGLESGQPRVFLGNVYLRAKSGYVYRQGQPQSDQLDVRFDLYGFLQPTRV